MASGALDMVGSLVSGDGDAPVSASPGTSEKVKEARAALAALKNNIVLARKLREEREETCTKFEAELILKKAALIDCQNVCAPLLYLVFFL